MLKNKTQTHNKHKRRKNTFKNRHSNKKSKPAPCKYKKNH